MDADTVGDGGGGQVSGGTSALFGFRYQMLRTIERLLALHGSSPIGDWEIEIESATDEKVDYAEWHNGHLTRAVQVKASLPGSTTRLRPPEAQRILHHLATRAPQADRIVLESNRRREGDWTRLEQECTASAAGSGPDLSADHDARDVAQVEQDIAAALRDIRGSRGRTVDPTVLRHLLFVLEGRLFQLGSTPLRRSNARRVMTSKELSDLVSVAGKELADLLGQVPWGRHWAVPRTDLVPRSTEFSWLAHSLSESALDRPGPPAAACLTGFSGAGKSSAAGAWADARQERYGMVIWLPARDEDSLADSVRRLLSKEYGQDALSWELPRLRDTFLDLLGRTPLSWLLVFDDARSASLLSRWMPSRGFGHVLITSTDATWPPSSAPSLELSAMTFLEVRHLVSQRLGAHSVESPAAGTALTELTEFTGGWPLAIEMVIAWIARTGRPLADVHVQIDHLSDVLLDREELIPVGYPRTVVAAVVDALDSAQSRPGLLPWSILLACARLGARSVPVRLVLATLSSPPSSLAEVDEAIGVLREGSLVRRVHLDEPIPAPWQDRLTVNDIVADLALRLAEQDSGAEMRAWEVLDSALRTSIDDGQFQLASSLEPLVEAALDGFHRGVRPMSLPGLSLHGNIATLYDEQGKSSRAQELLEKESMLARSVVEHPDVPARMRLIAAGLEMQTHIHLVVLACREGYAERALAASNLIIDQLLGSPGVFAPTKEQEFLHTLAAALGTIRHEGSRTARDRLLARIRESVPERSMDPLEQVEEALRNGRYSAARELIDSSLETETAPMIQLRMHAYSAEVEAYEDPQRVPARLRLSATLADALGAGHQHVHSAAVDCGNAAWTRLFAQAHAGGYRAVLRDQEQHSSAFRALVPFLPDLSDRALTFGTRVRTLLARAIHAVLLDSADARRLVGRAESALNDHGDRISEEEVLALRTGVQSTELLRRWIADPSMIEPREVIGQREILLFVVDRDELRSLARVAPSPYPLEIETILWFAGCSVHGPGGSRTVWFDLSGAPEQLLTAMSHGIPIAATDAATSTSATGSRAVDLENLLILGSARIELDAWVHDALRAAYEAYEKQG